MKETTKLNLLYDTSRIAYHAALQTEIWSGKFKASLLWFI